MSWTDEPMTVGELRKKIKNLPADTPVYLVTDKTSPYAWDDERERWRYAHPLAYASRERNFTAQICSATTSLYCCLRSKTLKNGRNSHDRRTICFV